MLDPMLGNNLHYVTDVLTAAMVIVGFGSLFLILKLFVVAVPISVPRSVSTASA
jgi:hypothetical protein